ncbi:MAG: AbgT family transporter [Ignavibacteria bacterium]|nr:AbgT family transporter [Ignavibacteria bacterium]
MKRSLFIRFLDAVERVGSKLPDPFTLFAIAAALVVVVSWFAFNAGVSVTHPGTGKVVWAINLLSPENIQRMFTDAVTNFTNFPPLGLVLVTMIGIAVAERGGFIAALLRTTVSAVPKSLLTAALVFAGVNSSIVADAGYVVLIPLGAVIFASVGRHPLAGLSATFAGVAGGFSANLSVTSLDPLLGGLTQAAAQLVQPDYVVSAAANWYFMIASTFFLTILITAVCEKLVEPRLGEWKGLSDSQDAKLNEKLSTVEKKGLKYAGIAFAILIAGLLWISVPEGAILRDVNGTLKPLEKSIVLILMLLFLISGIVYAKVTGSARNDKDIAEMAGDGMATMGGYIVLSFIMAQFISYFAWSNLGVVTAVNGAHMLQSLQLQGPFLLVIFVLVAALINLLIASASAKWAIMAPVFVPMFMLMGISAESTQLAYRIGDSSTNMIAPLLSYIPLILVAMRRYVKGASLGTLLSLMLPYSMAMIVLWTLFMLVWILMGLPLGPGVQ